MMSQFGRTDESGVLHLQSTAQTISHSEDLTVGTGYLDSERKASTNFARRSDPVTAIPDYGLPLLSDSVSGAVLLTVVWQSGSLGAAVYQTESASADLLMDVPDNVPFELLRSLIDVVKPNLVIISQNLDHRVKDVLIEICKPRETLTENESNEQAAANRDAQAGTPKLCFLASKEVGLGPARKRIERLRLHSMPEHLAEPQEIITYLASLIDFRHISMVRALGGLLHYLDKGSTAGAGHHGPSVVVAIRMFSMEHAVTVDPNSQRALRIFHADPHPSVFQAGRAKKEGISLFALFNRCKSSIGSKMMRTWFHTPTRNMAVLHGRHQAVQFFCNGENAVIKKEFEKSLGLIKDVTTSLGRLAKGSCTLPDWAALQKTVLNAWIISRLVLKENLPQDIEIFGKIADHFTKDLGRIAKIIQEVIDFDASNSEERFIIKPKIAHELDKLKRTLYNLHESLTYVAAEELANMTWNTRELRVSYIPHLGYLVVLQESHDISSETGYAVPGLDFVFKAKHGLFYKSERMRELDENYGDLIPKIHDYERTVMIQLQEIILRYTKLFASVMRYCAELDCLMSIATVASARNYVVPVMGDDLGIEIVDGRHPLQELYVTTFVTNRTAMGPEKNRIQIVTGPNMSGKSVYLKQVAAIVFLAHIGCPVPATSARIGFVDKIFTRLLTEETVAVRQSAFLIDLTQVALAVHYGTPRSLIILDEFGKGTRSADGLALTGSILNYFASDSFASRSGTEGPTDEAKISKDKSPGQTNTPLIILATHFHALRELVPPSETVTYKTMKHAKSDAGNMVFLYKIVPGMSGSSYALETSRLAGFGEWTRDRIRQVTACLRDNKPIPLLTEIRATAFSDVAEKIMSTLMDFDHTNQDARQFLDLIMDTVRASRS